MTAAFSAAGTRRAVSRRRSASAFGSPAAEARQPQCSQAFRLSRHQSTRIGVRTIDRETAS
jgi:hypothetical protein